MVGRMANDTTPWAGAQSTTKNWRWDCDVGSTAACSCTALGRGLCAVRLGGFCDADRGGKNQCCGEGCDFLEHVILRHLNVVHNGSV